MAERTQYCWLAGDQMNNWEFDDSEEMPSDCTSLYSSYCDLGPTDPVPKSPASSIPKTCTPETSTEEPEPSTTATPTGITTPTPTQSGMADKCNKFYKVQKDDGCQKIADDNKISVASLVSWNPDIGKECRNIKYDFYVCVGRESTSTSTSATTTGVTTPTPTQTGMVDGCDKFHKVEKDEGCQKIADDFSISVNQLKEWNPDVGKECTNLKYDFYACVGRSSSSGTSATTTTSVKSTTTANASGTPTPTQEGMVSGCKKFHKVLKDEYCAKIADESKISLNDFLSWNPDVGSNCGNLKYDFYVCIGK
jgi:LysM repeat protein